MEKHRIDKLESTKNSMATKWTLVGDRCSREFFEFHEGHRLCTIINELFHGGQTFIENDDIIKYVQSFYHHLYTQDLEVENNVQARQQCFRSVPTVIIEKHNRILLHELIEGEVRKTTFDLAKHKAMGVDKIPLEFFQEAWHEVRNDIKSLLQETFQKGLMHRDLNVGLQTFIPKLGEHNLIANYKPILVLGSTYKITSKTLDNRLQLFSPSWIRPTQIGFVQGRCILDNVFMAFEVMEWGRESDHDLVMFFLDFEKAYDKVIWTFL